MILYRDFFNTVKDGDVIIAVTNYTNKNREILYKDKRIHLSGYTFEWNNFFEANTPISIKSEPSNESDIK